MTIKPRRIFCAALLVIPLIFAACPTSNGPATKYYDVSIDNALQNGTISASPASGEAGTTVTLTIAPANGYRLQAGSLKYTPGNVPIPENTFVLPANNVTVTAVFEPLPENYYSVSIDTLQNGTISASPASGEAGTTITLAITPASGYRLQAGSLKYNPGDVAIPGTTFALPAFNVTVKAVFEPLPEGFYSVSIATLQNGSISASPLYGEAGTEITLTIAPAGGYWLKVGSLKYNPGNVAITGTTFPLPATNVTVTAVFETTTAENLVNAGIQALTEGKIDDAIAAFESAYQQDNSNSEAIVYSSLGALASIAGNQNVGNLMKDRLGFTGYPGTIDSLISGDWLESYPDDDSGSQMLPGLARPGWFTTTGIYTNNLTGAGALQASAWPLLFYANLVDKNQNGLNSLLDGILSAVFGGAFENAANRFSGLSYTQTVEVDEDIIDAFGLADILEGDIYIGRAELDILFSAVRLFKATLEWVAAYDWNTDISFLASDWEELTGISGLTIKNLPFGNNFMKDRSNGMMTRSKTDFGTALAGIIGAYDHLSGAASELPGAYVDVLKDYGWLRDGLSKLKTAISSGGKFYVPEQAPSGNSYANSPENAVFGIDLGKLFNPGQFAIDKLIEPESNGQAPKFYAFNTDDPPTAVTNKSQMNSLDESDYVGFKITLRPIKDTLVAGFAAEDEVLLPLFPAEIGKELYGLYHK
jgi:hypothetical protein